MGASQELAGWGDGGDDDNVFMASRVASMPSTGSTYPSNSAVAAVIRTIAEDRTSSADNGEGLRSKGAATDGYASSDDILQRKKQAKEKPPGWARQALERIQPKNASQKCLGPNKQVLQTSVVTLGGDAFGL